MSWKSPIDVIYGDVVAKFEGETLTAIQNVGIEVNKEELIKALSYDRRQYEEGYCNGYADGMKAAVRHGRWVHLGVWDAFECSVCGRQMVRNIFDYCPWCGASMDEVEDGNPEHK